MQPFELEVEREGEFKTVDAIGRDLYGVLRDITQELAADDHRGQSLRDALEHALAAERHLWSCRDALVRHGGEKRWIAARCPQPRSDAS